MTNTYAEPVARLLHLSRPEDRSWMDYRSLGFTQEDVPELIRLVQDNELRYLEPTDDLPDDAELPA